MKFGIETKAKEALQVKLKQITDKLEQNELKSAALEEKNRIRECCDRATNSNTNNEESLKRKRASKAQKLEKLNYFSKSLHK